MFHILGFIVIIFIVILVVGLTIVGSVLRAVFGFGRRKSTSDPTNNTRTYHTNSTGNRPSSDSSQEEVREQTNTKHKKIFTKEEGEYIDFEEVK